MIPGLALIDDILKGLPENARLRSEISELRLRFVDLESKLKDAYAEIDRLRQKYEALDSLDDQTAQLLVAIASAPDGAWKQELFPQFGLSLAKGDHVFDQLFHHGFVEFMQRITPDGRPIQATPKGRAYLSQRGLL